MRLFTRQRTPAVKTLRGKNRLNGSASFKTVTNRVNVMPYLDGPLIQIHRFPVERELPIVASIILLLFCRCPSAITRLVALIVINAVNAMFGARRRSHISNECHKAFAPACAHADTSCPIFVISAAVRIVTSANHSYPQIIKPGLAHAMRSISSKTHATFVIAVKTSTRLRAAVSESLTGDNVQVAA